jgi:hypothetical protein
MVVGASRLAFTKQTVHYGLTKRKGVCMDFRGWIEKVGPKTLHLATRVPLGTIYAWSSRNMIPRGRWPDLQVIDKRLTTRALLDMEIESKSTERA